MDVKMWENEAGDCPVSECIEELQVKVQEKLVRVIERLEEYGTRLLYTKHMKKLQGYDLYELRIEFNKVFYRILLVIIDTTGWLLHFFIKKSKHTPQREIDVALNRCALLKQSLGITV